LPLIFISSIHVNDQLYHVTGDCCTFVLDEVLAAGMSYKVRVQATNDAGQGPLTPLVSVKVRLFAVGI
jgi:hypothetical protein